MRNTINLLIAAAIMLATCPLQLHAQDAQTNRIWKTVSESQLHVSGERYTFPSKFRALQINTAELKQLLAQAPSEPSTTARLTNGLTFYMPMPDGSFQRFQVFEYNVMHPDLAAKFPEIKTYTGQGIDDNSSIIKISLSPIGFHAMVLSANGSVFIDPYCKNNTSDYMCYYRQDLQRTSTFECSQNDAIESAEKTLQYNQQLRTNGTQLRTYDLALACTGEYAAFFGGTVSGATAGMVATMNRVNGIYEAELSIRMQMVANNNLITYTNSSTDPYTNGNGSTMLGQNQTTCDNIIGSANYDIGHVVSTGGGGVAGLGVVCSGGNKARGVTGSGSPTGDAFDVDYVAHEIGHQFGGSHTFNSATGSCNGNRTSSAAFEPGSGITIQAYAGICGSDNLAPNSIAYFHGYSLDQMITFSTTGTGNSCPTTTANGNLVPVVTNMAANCSIPISTPFVLTGAATDGNGDPLTYSWEERDLGPAGAWNVQSTTAPQFRTFPPTSSPSRTFPKLSDIINNTTTIGELLPNQARTLKFRLTARDYRAGGGGIMHPDTNVIVQVVNSGGAFAVTAPNTAVTWAGGSTQSVTWNVSGTTGNGINTANVKISLSTDGGNTFPTVILASTANDGSESITVPNTATTTARIKVEAVGNIFFDMSNTNFTITAGAVMSVITTTSIAQTNYCAGASLNVSYTTNGPANAGNIFTAQLSNAAGSFASPTSVGTLTSTAAGTISCTIPAGTSSGNGYRIRVVSSNPSVTGSDNGANITVSAQVAAAGSITGFNTVCQGAAPFYSVSAIANATAYNWSVPPGASIISGAGTATVQIAFGTATTGNVSVYGSNANCTGSASNLSVTINPQPSVFNVTGGGAYCTGGSGVAIGLSDSETGAGYQLIRNGSVNVGSPVTGTGSAISFGNQTVAGTYTVNAAFATGCNSNMTGSASVTINSLPTVTANNVSGCAGTAIALSGTPAGGTWSVANPYTGPSTTYTHTYTDGNGCTNTSSAASITVNPNPTPSITGNLSFCEGSSATLDAGAGYTAYLWSNGATTQSTTADVAGTYTVTVTNASGCTGSTSVTTIENPAPTPSITGNLGFCTGSSTSLDAGAGYASYNWSTGATSQTINVNTAGTFTVTVYNANGCSAATSVSTTVNSLPTANTSPNGTVTTCNTSQLLTTNNGAGLSYQWQLNGSNINGATNISYNVTANGNYAVIVTQSGCSSASATVSVSLGAGSPVITSSGGTNICAGSSTTLSAPAGASAYQWYRNSVAQAGAVSQTFVASSNGSYYCNVTGACSGNSNTIVLNVINNPTPAISNSTSLVFCNGGMVELTSSTFAGVAFQWQKNSVDIAGATSQTFTATTSGAYRVKQTANGCFKYAPAVSVNAAGSSVSANISAGGPLTFCSGGSVTLSVDNAIPGYAYQWKNNTANIPGATLTSYSATASGSYTCTITASCGTATSNAITVSTGSITATIVPSGTITICSGATAMLQANSGAGYTYQWQLNGSDINGATSGSYSASVSGNYTVAISSPCGNNTSAATTVNVSSLSAAVTPAGTSVICAGSNIIYTANTGFNYTYQWYRNGVALPGITTSAYAASSNGNYTVLITQGGACSSTSNTAVLSVTNNPTPSITPAGPTTFCAGSSVTLNTNTFAGVVYQWERNSVAIAGATNQSFIATTSGAYRVKQTANGCYKYATAVTVTVNCRLASGNVSSADDVMDVVVSPNPFSNEFTVSGIEFTAGDKIQLVNMIGRTVWNKTIHEITPETMIQTGNIPTGVYFLEINSSKGKSVLKLMKQ